MRGLDRLRLEAGAETLPLEDGSRLRLLPVAELLAARREALDLAQKGQERALCSNACLIARALVREGVRVYPSGQAVLEALTPEEIQTLAEGWAAFDRREDPGFSAPQARVDALKTALGDLPQERLRWRVLRAFRALPTEARVKAMLPRDYLWCALHLLLDQEEAASLLCPTCRAEAEEPRCPVCGRPTGEITREENPGFDMERFLALRRGEGGGAA
ncbi:MAG: hypothetical protein ACI3VS_07895 [Evtepia sp.]